VSRPPDPVDLGPDPVVLLVRRVASRLTPSGRVTTAALSLIAVQMLFHGWITSGSWFEWDDYIFLADVARGDADTTWLFHSHFGLFMPVSFLLVKIVGGVGLSWAAVATQILVLQLLASLACWWMLRTVFGNRLRILVPLAFYLFSPMAVPTGVWWSVAINQYPHHIAIFGAIACHVRYARTSRLRHAAAATAFLLLGVGSYVKSPLIVVVLVGISVCWFTSDGLGDRLRMLWRAWPAWILYGGTVGVYVVVWASRQTGALPRQSCELKGVFSHSILESVGTGATGGPLTWRLWTGGVDPFLDASSCAPLAYRGDRSFLIGGPPQSLLSPSLTVIVLSWLLIVALVLYVWARHRHAVVSLWWLVPYVLLSALLVHLGRAGTFGSQVSAREMRYFADVPAVMSLAIGAAIMPILGAVRQRRLRSRPYLRVSVPRRAFAVLAVLGLVASLVSSVRYVAPWHSHETQTFPGRAFMQTVDRQLDERAASDGPVVIADVPVPFRVALPTIAPYNLPSRQLAPWSDRIRAVTAGTDLSMLDDGGRILRATIPDAPRAEPGPVEACGYLVQQERESIDITPVVDTVWWARIDYLAGGDGEIEVRAGDSSHVVPVERGLHTAFVQTTGAYDAVSIRARGEISVCVDNVHVGTLEGQDPRP
jgi:hypothetical protein